MSVIDGLIRQLDASPTPRHLVAYWTPRLIEAGFADATGSQGFRLDAGFVAREGALIAWRGISEPARGLRIVGAHTDSPGLHLKPVSSREAFGVALLNVEPYGSPLLNSWVDRDLDLVGHVVDRSGRVHLLRSPEPLARLAQLAIHLDREVNERGLVLDRHQHLAPIWSLNGHDDVGSYAAALLGIDPSEVLASELQLVDAQGARVVGRDGTLLSSGRLDNQVSCWAALDALLDDGRGVVALFDHEEVGSTSTTGAAGPLLDHVLERLVQAADGGRREYLDMLNASHMVSADNAHALHPNYPERYDLSVAPRLGAGPAVKWNVNQRYATSTDSAAPFIAACDEAGVPIQRFSSRNTIPCGSTIGPLASTRLGISTVDVGVPQLAMHSARETCAVADVVSLRSALSAYLR